MKQVIAVIRPFQTEKLLRALCRAGHSEITIREVHGYGRQNSYLSEYRENEFSETFLPKIEICVWVEPADVEAVIDIVIENCRTGRMGDGKVFCVGGDATPIAIKDL